MNPMGYSSLTEGNHREDVTREDLIRDYFYGGYTNLEICGILLLRHEIVISIRHLKRILAMIGLRRRMLQNTVEASYAIMEELNGSGSSLGCRGLQRRLLSHGLVVSRLGICTSCQKRVVGNKEQNILYENNNTYN